MVVLVYLVLFGALIAGQAVSFRYLSAPPIEWSGAFGAAASSFWEPSQIVTRQGGWVFYLLSGALFVIGTLLPVVLLGAFVFKLFRHDPITWRHEASLEWRDGQLHGCVRFFNRFDAELVDLSVTAWLRVVSPVNDKVISNRRLDLRSTSWPVASPGVPFTVRFPVMSSEALPAASGDWTVDSVQGIPVASSSELLFQLSGLMPATGESFTSVKRYTVGQLSEAPFREVTVLPRGRPMSWPGWREFHEAQPAYVFGYGSLVRPDSLSRTLGREVPDDQMATATLRGFRLAWNVASDPLVKGRRYVDASGRSFTGCLVYLGVEQDDAASVVGRVFRVTLRDLALLDARELSYQRVDVSDDMSVHDARGGPAVTYCYVPRPEARSRLADAVQSGSAVLLAEYQRRVVEALGDLSREGARTASTVPRGVRIEDLHQIGDGPAPSTTPVARALASPAGSRWSSRAAGRRRGRGRRPPGD